MNNIVKSKRGKIAPYQIFLVLFVSRIVVTLTYVQTVSVGKLGTDFLFSIVISCVFTIILSIPSYLSVKNNKSVLLPYLYAVYFSWLAGVGISRFSYFASSRVNTSSSMVLFIIVISVAAGYCAVLGIEGISRFGSFCGLLLVITLAIVLLFNVHNFHFINFLPVYSNSLTDIFKNAFVMASNSTEPAVFLILSNRINGNKSKPLFLSLLVSYITVLLIIAFVVGVMGANASLQSYPIFALFQMASAGSLSRLDMLHTSFWVLALLLKSSLLIYSASVVVKRFTHVKKAVFFSVLVAIISIIINEALSTSMAGITKALSVVTFVLFVVALPVISLFMKNNTRSNEVENN